jgi:N-acetylmuramoyl-L-alanine amidase
MRLAAFVLLVAAAVCARAEPELGSIRSGGIDYVCLQDAAPRLGLRLVRSIPSTSVMLKDGVQPVARLADHSRDADIKGLRVFLGDQAIEHGGKFYVSRNDFDFRLLPRLRPDLCGPPPRQPHVIVIDPGHGGEDHGTENQSFRTMEKTYTLDVSLRLRRLLEDAGYKVMMIRDKDVTIPKEERAAIANQWSPDFFVSIHFNSLFPNTKTTGVEVMVFPPRTQRSAESWSVGKKDDSEATASPINAFNAWNSVLAGALHRRVLAALKTGDRGEKFEHLAVLRGLNCPGVLVESAFLSSDAEAARLAMPAYRDKIAGALLAGIQDYSEEIRRLHPAAVAPPASAPSPSPTPRALPTRPSAAS